MANLQIKGIEDDLYEEIKKLAVSENRSLSQEILFLVKDYLAKRHVLRTQKTPAQTLLELSGSWEDDSAPEEIIADIKACRKNSEKLHTGF
jgi:hypothetical protein